MKTILVVIVNLVLFISCACAADKPLAPPKDMPFNPQADDDEENVEPSKNPIAKKYQDGDEKSPPPKGGILFAGSSSIQKWTSLTNDFKPLQVLNRGVGGSVVADWVKFVPQLVNPYKPKVIVFYAGDNDIAAKKTPEQVTKDFVAFSTEVKKHNPDVKMFFISLKPSVKRELLWPKMVQTNTMVQQYCKSTTWIQFVDISAPMLNNGKPIPELFGPDKLHMNATGYAIWTRIMKPKLAGGPVAAGNGVGGKTMPDAVPPGVSKAPSETRVSSKPEKPISVPMMIGN